MHLLAKDIPVNEQPGSVEEMAWVRTSYFIQWSDRSNHKPSSDQDYPSSFQEPVTFICFGAVKHFRDRCVQLRTSSDWEQILDDPLTLVGWFLESWYNRLDRIVWTANQRGSELESVSRIDSTSSITIDECSKR
jgi:hypothetical protein